MKSSIFTAYHACHIDVQTSVGIKLTASPSGTQVLGEQ